jgi:glycine cleavage system transcriptional repressor
MSQVVLTLTGPDRVGLVEEVTRDLLELGGNVETSRMTRLGGEFAILMLVSLSAENVPRIEEALRRLTDAGFVLTVRRTMPSAGPSGTHYRIHVEGADHEGIIHEIAAGLSSDGVNIESMDTETVNAPESGTPFFSMIAIVTVPGDLPVKKWQGDLERAAADADVDLSVEAI